MTTLPDLPPPYAVGAPEKFTHWRKGQDGAVLASIDASTRFVAQSMPTGSGKSLMYVARATLTGDRSIILTSTKGLQDQLVGDFSEIGMKDVRGMNAYPCDAMKPGGSLWDRYRVAYSEALAWGPVACDDGPCRAGVECILRKAGCQYYSAVSRARYSQLVTTNYAYWMTTGRSQEMMSDPVKASNIGIGEAQLLVLDEAHDAPDILSDFIKVTITNYEVSAMLGSGFLDEDVSVDAWREWACYHGDRANATYESLSEMIKSGDHRSGLIKEAREFRALASKLDILRGIRDDWIIEPVKGGMGFDPLWPAEFAERYLFRGSPRVVLVSATIRPKTLELLGVRDYTFLEYDSDFPVDRRPVYHVPTVRVDHNITAHGLGIWAARIDQVIKSRKDRKGIVHTVSYDRACKFVSLSTNRGMIITHSGKPGELQRAVERFKRSRDPVVLVSPSVTTGYDFPYQECEYQVISKVPFPDQRSKILKARQERDRDYGAYIAMQTLVQSSGRGMRARDDQCEVFILDDHARWFMGKFKGFAPKWFLDSYSIERVIPEAPLRLS